MGLKSDFIHLHTHSNFSFLDGASPPERLVERAAELGMSALALTDHHGLYGAVRFLQAASAHGVNPIVGLEIEVETSHPKRDAPQGTARLRAHPRNQRTTPNSKQHDWNEPSIRSHLTLLARDRQGYASLCRIVSKAQLEHQDDPHLSLEDLASLARQVVVLSGCPRGPIASALPGESSNNLNTATAMAQALSRMFGGRNFWIELQHHRLPGDDRRICCCSRSHAGPDSGGSSPTTPITPFGRSTGCATSWPVSRPTPR